ncbi:mechanosensitive ion channel family protein [Pseudoduganella sp. UC29_106]|uniref:mechanosensitive ion channel family protein n=1 Tax=Pseudoduganella sp. UC29_106 TaxID=3374553 RepID=UPI003756BCE9
MAQTVPLTNLINDLIGDVRDPGLMWQVAAIVLSIFLGWTLSLYLRKRLEQRDSQGVVRFGVESFGRVVGPLAIVCLLAVCEAVLRKWQHVNLIKVALPIFGSLAVIRIAFFLLRRVFARGGEVGKTLLTFEKVFQLLVWLGFALYITGIWDEIFVFLDETVIPIGKHRVSIAAILQGAVSVVVLLILAMWAGAALEERLMNMQTVSSNLRVVFARLGRAVLIVVAVLLSLSLVGIDLTVLSVFGGALGVGLGLGLQKIASNYVSGFIILLDRSLTIGDVITVDKFSGQVTHINTRYTVLMSGDGVESIVPNEMLISSAVQNSSLSNRWVALQSKVSVAYDSDVDQVLRLMEEAAASIERVSKEKKPGGSLQNFGADGLDLAVTFWIQDPENGRGNVTSDVNRAIWKSLKQNGISVPFPQREVRLLGPLPEPLPQK